MLRTSFLLALVLGIAFTHVSHAESVHRFKSHVTYLSSDELAGRGIGSPGIRKASKYIATQFHSLQLEPLPDGSYFQSFQVSGRQAKENNVVGWVRAANPTTRSLIFIAHYDGFGSDDSLSGEDRIFNGARDNAAGVAALIELARYFSARAPFQQNVVLIASAAEETGMLGAQHYLSDPAFPIADVSMVFNLDGFNVTGPREDFFIMPRTGIDYLDLLVDEAASLGWKYESPDWVDSMDNKFDSAVFLSNGTPAVTLWTGSRLPGGDIAPQGAFGGIHSVDDEINDAWDWRGIDDHLKLYTRLAEFILCSPYSLKVTNPKKFRPQTIKE